MASRPHVSIDDALPTSMRGFLPAIAGLLAALVVWRYSLAQVDIEAMSDLELMSVLPPAFYASVLILTFSFSLSVTRRRSGETVLAMHVAVLIVLLYALPMLLYDTLRLPWAWKHLGVVDYILRHGTIDPDIAVMPAYHNWPGFFALIAFLVDLAGRDTLLALAIWSPLAIHLVLIGVLLLVFRSLTDDRQIVWMSIWLYYLANWVGQDYFSPQAFVFPLYLSVIGLSLAFLKPVSASRPATGRRSLFAVWHRLLDGAAKTEAGSRIADPSLWLVATLLMLLAAMTVSHQLTPAAIILSLTALYLFRRLKSLWLPFAAIAIFGAWLIGPARGFMASELTYINQLAGDLFGNTSANFQDLTLLSRGQAWIAIISRALTGVVLLLALGGGIMRLLNGRFDVSAALLVVAPFAILLIHSYDGEGVFRSYMFASPFLAFFAACLLCRAATAIGRQLSVTFLTIILCLLGLGWLGAYYGKDHHTYALPEEALAFEFLALTAPENSLLVEGSPDYPVRFRDYEHFTYVSIVDEPSESLDLIMEDPAKELGDWLSNDRYAASYILLTRSQKIGIEALGRLPAGTFDLLVETLRRSDRFRLAFENDAAVIFVLNRDEPAR